MLFLKVEQEKDSDESSLIFCCGFLVQRGLHTNDELPLDLDLPAYFTISLFSIDSLLIVA